MPEAKRSASELKLLISEAERFGRWDEAVKLETELALLLNS